MIETIIKKVPAASSLGFVIEAVGDLKDVPLGFYGFDEKGRQCGEWRELDDFDGKIQF